MLEANGFVTKQVASDKKSKLLYQPTVKSIALAPVVLEIGLWGSTFHSPWLEKELIDAMHRDRERTIQRIQAKLRGKIAAAG